MHMPKIFGIWFLFIWKDKVILISLEQKSHWGHIIYIHKSYNEIVDKMEFISL